MHFLQIQSDSSFERAYLGAIVPHEAVVRVDHQDEDCHCEADDGLVEAAAGRGLPPHDEDRSGGGVGDDTMDFGQAEVCAGMWKLCQVDGHCTAMRVRRTRRAGGASNLEWRRRRISCLERPRPTSVCFVVFEFDLGGVRSRESKFTARPFIPYQI